MDQILTGNALANALAGLYATVAASVTSQVLGDGGGAKGDYIEGILVIPSDTSPGAITLSDKNTVITIFAGGADSLSNLVPFFIPLGIKSKQGPWSITTGADVTAIAAGNFS